MNEQGHFYIGGLASRATGERRVTSIEAEGYFAQTFSSGEGEHERHRVRISHNDTRPISQSEAVILAEKLGIDFPLRAISLHFKEMPTNPDYAEYPANIAHRDGELLAMVRQELADAKFDVGPITNTDAPIPGLFHFVARSKDDGAIQAFLERLGAELKHYPPSPK
jgi:hypothetical protein